MVPRGFAWGAGGAIMRNRNSKLVPALHISRSTTDELSSLTAHMARSQSLNRESRLHDAFPFTP